MGVISDAQRERLIDKYRDINVDDGYWYEYIFDEYKETLGETGFSTRGMCYTGFWNQGDGASFCGEITSLKLFMDKQDMATDYPMLYKIAVQCFEGNNYHTGYHISLLRNGHGYSHANTVDLHADVNMFPGDEDDDFLTAVHSAWNEKLEQEVPEFEKAAQEILRDYMKNLYRDLEKEYNYQTSDEAVWESIEANDLHKDLDDDDAE